jgi:hypothetical protein
MGILILYNKNLYSLSISFVCAIDLCFLSQNYSNDLIFSNFKMFLRFVNKNGFCLITIIFPNFKKLLNELTNWLDFR